MFGSINEDQNFDDIYHYTLRVLGCSRGLSLMD